MDNKQVYLIHGYTANPNANWFPWLKKKAGQNLDVKIHVLSMPNSDNPDPARWEKKCSENIKSDGEVTIIGHSLGCVQALRFLEKHNIQGVHLILVSGFDETTSTLPELASFTSTAINYREVLKKVKDAVVISAIDDDIVPFYYAETLARHLKCKFILMPNGKHFIDRDEITELPIVFDELAKIYR
ncbi:RBBP9/YdeN family alpha/beta hydrolase [Lentilactobacillus hilgardii]|uniref:RBBP9/YdeN family alpha/beta hydrolase n=1 Tax=Lentilactobacillus hilgardii TaxID=1588 RepID=UPI0021C4890C|nr:alpha/beta hydrolase [Lentilactobacillus hilgardii]